MAKRHGTATVATVAELAGVSPGTVSKALNGGGQLKETTRARVIEAAATLGFQPNVLARSLTSGRTFTIGVLTTDSIGRFTIPILTGAEDALGAWQMSILLCESRGDPIREQHYLRMLLAHKVDGIIVTGRSSDVRKSLGKEFPVPVVYALVESDNPEDVSVLHDDATGAAVAVRHLLETGRENIAYVAGPARHLASMNRLKGALSALSEAGRTMVTGSPLYGEWSEKWGREAARRLILSGEKFDGIFCASDQIARGVADGLRENDISVPEQVGIVGVDNWDVMVDSSRPPLSTIDLNLAELGHVAATRLLALIDGEEVAAGVELVASTLIKRRSTETD